MMAPPSKLAIATSSVNRLIKEEASYHKELVQQEARIKKLEASGNEDDEYQARQEKRAVEETKVVIPSVRNRISEAIAKLEGELEAIKDTGSEASEEEINKANEAITTAKSRLSEAS